MKFTIITPSFNSAQTIEETIQSVLSQQGVEFEYIVVDGGSTDGTLPILQKYQDRIKFVSEPDNGVYDAMNKGILMSSGDVIAILNSDDFYVNNHVLSEVCGVLSNSSVCYADLEIVGRADTEKVLRFWKSGIFNLRNFRKGWAPPHPTLFVKKYVYEQVGMYRLDLSLAADYEWMIRAFVVHNLAPVYLPRVLVRMRDGGMSSVNLFARLKGWSQILQAWRINNLSPAPILLFRRIFGKLRQFNIL